MPDIRLVKVVAMAPTPGSPGGTIKTDTLGELTVARRKEWTTLEMGFVKGWPMSLKIDEGEVTLAWPADTDHLRALGAITDPGDRLVVDLMQRQTFLYLDRQGPRFAELHRVLALAFRNKTQVSVAVAPGGELIDDAR